MKRKIILITSLVFAVIFSFSACVNNGSSSSSEGEITPNNPVLDIAEAKDKNGETIMLTRNGQSDYDIVLSSQPDVYETFAAKELQEFLRASTGATLDIISTDSVIQGNSKYLYIGNATNLQSKVTVEEYGAAGGYVDVEGESVYLTGAKGYGTINAVYEFLEYEIGWKAYATDEIYYQIKPNLPLLAFNDLKYQTTVDYMNARIGSLFGPSNRYEAARMGFVEGSYTGGVMLDGKLWASWLSNLDSLVKTTDEKAAIEKMHGVELDSIVAERLPAKLEDAKKEYIAENGEEPTEDVIAKLTTEVSSLIRNAAIEENSWYWFSNGQLCLSKTEISDFVTEKVKELLLNNPQAEYLLLGNFDKTATCECDYCKEKLKTCGTHGGISMDFMNRISKNLEDEKFFENNPETNENVMLCYMNYLGYVAAPVEFDSNGNVIKTFIKARDNVGTFLCPISACYNHALDDPDCEINVKELRNFKGWSETTDFIGVYIYWANYRNNFTYFNNWVAPRTWGRLFNEYNVKYAFIHGVDNTFSTFGELRVFLYSNYLKDPECGEFEGLVQDFMKNYYKVAADEMYEYFNAIRRHTTAMQYISGSSCSVCYDDKNQLKYTDKKWWSWETLNSMLEYVEKAYISIENSSLPDAEKEKLKDRILIEEITLRYWKYKFWSSYYTSESLEQERLFLKTSCEKLGLRMESEYGKLVWD